MSSLRLRGPHWKFPSSVGRVGLQEEREGQSRRPFQESKLWRRDVSAGGSGWISSHLTDQLRQLRGAEGDVVLRVEEQPVTFEPEPQRGIERGLAEGELDGRPGGPSAASIERPAKDNDADTASAYRACNRLFDFILRCFVASGLLVRRLDDWSRNGTSGRGVVLPPRPDSQKRGGRGTIGERIGWPHRFPARHYLRASLACTRMSESALAGPWSACTDEARR